MSWIKKATVAACVVAMIAFTAGIGLAGYYSLWAAGAPLADRLPAIVSYFVGAANATLAANLGSVLGIAITAQMRAFSLSTTDNLQLVAAVWYVVSLLIAVVLWGIAGFTEDPTKVVPLLPELSRNGIGILLAILAATLGVNATQSARMAAAIAKNTTEGGKP